MPIVTLPDPALAVDVADALLEAGLPCMEVTFRAAGAAEAISAIRRLRPDMLVGAGTVVTMEQADAALDAGAAFIVAPGTSPRVVGHVLARHGVMLPGVATPSEIEANLEHGIRLMKFFPAEAAGGLAFLKAVGDPFRDVSFVPTGGIDARNLAAYLARANVTAVGGTWIAPWRVLEAGDLATVCRTAGEAMSIVANVRRPQPASR